ncbi:MAG: vitamin K epoxide reductase family protein, partial [Planctomycetota bacterium]
MNLSSGSGSVAGVVSGRTVWFLRGLCATGLGISAYLAWKAFRMEEVFGCGGGGSVFDCSHVLTSKWSKVFGIPVSVPAAGLYASLLTLLAIVRWDAPAPFRRLLWSGMTLGALMAGLAALWFIGLQVFVLQHLCWYCLTVHTCGLVLAAIMLRGKWLSLSDKSRLGTMAALGVAGLMTVQIISREADHFEVVTFDDLPAETSSEEGDIASADVFAAPGEDVFEAPVPDVFEAPGAEGEIAPTEGPAAERSTGNSDVAQPVAATVLTILMPRMSLLTEFPLSFQEAAAAEQESKPVQAEAVQKSDLSGSSKDAALPTEEAPKPRTVTVANNRMTLNPKQWPI